MKGTIVYKQLYHLSCKQDSPFPLVTVHIFNCLVFVTFGQARNSMASNNTRVKYISNQTYGHCTWPSKIKGSLAFSLIITLQGRIQGRVQGVRAPLFRSVFFYVISYLWRYYDVILHYLGIWTTPFKNSWIRPCLVLIIIGKHFSHLPVWQSKFLQLC
jgi:hypothetical protein